MKMLFLVASFAVAAVASAADTGSYSESDFAAIEKIDTHVHLAGDLPAFIARAEQDRFRVLTINVNYSAFPQLSQQREDAVALRQATPERIAFTTTFDAADSHAKEWRDRTQSYLRDTLAQGAVGVKVWKDIGMQQRDPDGRVVMIDDPRFEPIFTSLERRGVVVLGHLGEPRNAWLPLEQMTIRGDRQYFTDHPEYHMAAHPEWPTYEQQLAARDRLLDRHPRMQFVAVHLASLEWNVDEVAAFLERYPRASVDLAARLVHVKLQASKDRERVRQFFVQYQDRILYATDLTKLAEQTDAAFADEAHAVWLDDWRFLATEQRLTSMDFEGEFQGLGLPKSVVNKIYAENARRIFPGAWRK